VKVYYHFHNSPPMDFVLKKTDPVCTLTLSFLKIRFDIMLLDTPRSQNFFLLTNFYNKTAVRIFPRLLRISSISSSSSSPTTSCIECFGLLNDFFPFMPVLNAVLPIIYFHGIQIILTSFLSISTTFISLPNLRLCPLYVLSRKFKYSLPVYEYMN
jgi:hypothetical protein